jgi:hypothetical protein
MKKLLLAFSLIAVFGIGITAASITLPENEKPMDEKNSTIDSEKPACCEKESLSNNKKPCCKKLPEKS